MVKELKLSSAIVRYRLRKRISSGLLCIIGAVQLAMFGFSLVNMIALDIAHGKLESAIDKLSKHSAIGMDVNYHGTF